MLRVQYIGKAERTVGVDVVYPGELMSATPSMLAAWRAEHGDLFAVVGELQPQGGVGGVVIDTAGGAHVFAEIAEADDAAKATVKGGGRGRTR